MAEFTDRVVLVTGSSSGIGEQIARRFAELGASVVVNSSTSVAAGEQLAAELGEQATYVQADIADREQARRLVDATVERFGALDVLVNNAGWTTRVDHRDLDALTDEIFLRDVRGQRVRHVVAHEGRDPAPPQQRRRQHRQHHVDRRPATGRVVDGVRDEQGRAQPDDAAARQVVRADSGQRRRAGAGGHAVDERVDRPARRGGAGSARSAASRRPTMSPRRRWRSSATAT